MWRIEFRSEKFLPFLPEEQQANPGVYGFELAAWLVEGLAGRGVAASYPLGDDWGWLLQYDAADGMLLIGCSSVCLEGKGYAGEPIIWSIFVDRKGRTTDVLAERVQREIADLVHSLGCKIEVVEA